MPFRLLLFAGWLCTLVSYKTQVCKATTFPVQILPGTDHSRYRSFQVQIIPGTDHSRYRSFQVQIIPGTDHSRYRSFQVQIIPGTDHSRYRSFQVQIIPGTDHSRYRYLLQCIYSRLVCMYHWPRNYLVCVYSKNVVRTTNEMVNFMYKLSYILYSIMCIVCVVQVS